MADFPPPRGKGVGFRSVQIKGAGPGMFSHVPRRPDETCPAEAWTFHTSRLHVMFNKFCALNVFEGCFSVKLFWIDGLRAFSHALDQILEPITSSLTVPWEHKIGLNEQSDILCPKTALWMTQVNLLILVMRKLLPRELQHGDQACISVFSCQGRCLLLTYWLLSGVNFLQAHTLGWRWSFKPWLIVSIFQCFHVKTLMRTF